MYVTSADNELLGYILVFSASLKEFFIFIPKCSSDAWCHHHIRERVKCT